MRYSILQSLFLAERQRMSQLTSGRIMQAFQNLSLSDKDYLSKEELTNAMNKLNEQPFDEQTFEQLWEQCKLNSKGQGKLSQFIAYIIKAEQILAEKLTHASIKIYKHEISKRPKTNEYAEVQQYREQLQQLTAQQESINLSLKIIRKPFLNTKRSLYNKDKSSEKASIPPTAKQSAAPIQDQIQQQYLFDYDSSQTVQTLTKILYWSITLLVLNCFCVYLFSLFVDMLVCGVLLLSYCLQTINRKLIKFNLCIIGFSIIYTFLWLVLYTDKFWYPAKSLQYPTKFSTYINLSIMTIIAGQVIKLLLFYYYLTILQIQQEQVFSIQVGSRTLFLKNDPNVKFAQKNPLIYALKDVFNKAPAQLCKPQLQV